MFCPYKTTHLLVPWSFNVTQLMDCSSETMTSRSFQKTLQPREGGKKTLNYSCSLLMARSGRGKQERGERWQITWYTKMQITLSHVSKKTVPICHLIWRGKENSKVSVMGKEQLVWLCIPGKIHRPDCHSNYGSIKKKELYTWISKAETAHKMTEK